MRRFLVPTIVIAYALGAVVALGQAWSGAQPEQSGLSLAALDKGSIYSLNRDSGTTGPRLVPVARGVRQSRPVDPVEAPGSSIKSDRPHKPASPVVLSKEVELQKRFEAKRTLLSRERMVAAFETAGIAASARSIALNADPAPGRFVAAPVTGAMTGPLLAFADPEPSSATDAFSAIDGVMPDEFDIPADDGTLSDEFADTPDYDDYDMTPSDAPLPGLRPRAQRSVQPEPEAESPAKTEKAEKPARIQKPEIAEKPKKPAGTLFAFAKPNDPAVDRAAPKLAFAKPNDPSDGKAAPKPFKNFLNRPKAGNGVAVYDISAAKVIPQNVSAVSPRVTARIAARQTIQLERDPAHIPLRQINGLNGRRDRS